jgi:hypothetical protein
MEGRESTTQSILRKSQPVFQHPTLYYLLQYLAAPLKHPRTIQHAYLFHHHCLPARDCSCADLPRMHDGSRKVGRMRSSHQRQRLLQQVPVERSNVDMYRRN